jgi:hypothetical protein
VPPSRFSRLYPLRGLPRQGQLWSWISFDVANQSFTLIINTLLFSIFFQKVVVRDPSKDDLIWTLTYAASMLLVVMVSPFAGALADARHPYTLGLLNCLPRLGDARHPLPTLDRQPEWAL